MKFIAQSLFIHVLTSLQSLRAAVRICELRYEEHLHFMIYTTSHYNEVVENSVLEHLDPFIRHNFIKDQSFCWNEETQINLMPVFGGNGLCYTFNAAKDNFNHKA